MKPKNDITQELQELGLNTLATCNKETGFKVPEGFFENLSTSIIDQVEKVNKEKETRNIWFFNFRTVSAVAASLLVLAVFAISFLFIINTKQNGAFSKLSDQAYDEYFASLDEFDRMLVNEFLLEFEPNDLDANEIYFHEEDESLIDYLIDETNYQRFDPLYVLDLENK